MGTPFAGVRTPLALKRLSKPEARSACRQPNTSDKEGCNRVVPLAATRIGPGKIAIEPRQDLVHDQSDQTQTDASQAHTSQGQRTRTSIRTYVRPPHS